MFIMDERSFYYRRVVIRPRMSQASAERQITEQTRNRRPMVQTNRHTRDRVGIAGKEQTSARQLAISCIKSHRLNTGSDIHHIKAYVRVQAAEISCALYRSRFSGQVTAGDASAQHYAEIIVEPPVRTGSGFDDAQTDVSAVR